jgi:RimJ/RimL family protein N-acetyltransferase
MAIIDTERLLLREFTIDDAAFILELLNSPGWLQYIGDRNIKTFEDASQYLLNGPMKSYDQNGFGLSMVEIKEGNIPIGMCGLIKRETLEHIDIGFAFLPQYSGKGYAHEIAIATIEHARNNLKISKIVAITTQGNHNSIRLLNKIGLKFEKNIRFADEEEELMLFT